MYWSAKTLNDGGTCQSELMNSRRTGAIFLIGLIVVIGLFALVF